VILLSLEVIGNQDDPIGNPIPYTRTTRRGKHRTKDKSGRPTQYGRYVVWKSFVKRSLSREDEAHLVQEIWQLIKSERYQFYLDCWIQFKGRAYGDVDNILKGIVDALFPPKRCGGPDDHLIRARPIAVRDSQECGWVKAILLGPFPREDWPKLPSYGTGEICGKVATDDGHS